MNKKIQAFTLIELTVVITIIALIIGAVVGGQELLKSTKNTSIVTDSQKYLTAISNFRTKYHALPGDLSRATSFFTDTENGNNDGEVTLASSVYEQRRAWQHLSLADMVKGSYVGTGGATGVTPGTHAPKSNLENSWFHIEIIGVNTGSASLNTSLIQRNLFLRSGDDVTAKGNSIFTPTDAYSLDKKTDDGNALSGKVQAMKGDDGASGTCIDTSLTPDDYKLTDATTSCILQFPIR